MIKQQNLCVNISIGECRGADRVLHEKRLMAVRSFGNIVLRPSPPPIRFLHYIIFCARPSPLFHGGPKEN